MYVILNLFSTTDNMYICTIICFMFFSGRASGCLTGHLNYIPDHARREDPDLPDWELIKDKTKNIDPDCVCGRSVVKQSDEDLAVASEFPWQVYIRVFHDYGDNKKAKPLRGRFWQDGFHDCAGTIINDVFILTSSGCILDFYPAIDSNPALQVAFIHQIKRTREVDPSNIRVYYDIISKDAKTLDKHKFSEVEKIFYHPQLPYPSRDFRLSDESDYDIVILKLRNKFKFTFSSEVSPICLPPVDHNIGDDWNKKITRVVGWYSRPSGAYLENVNLNQLEKITTGHILHKCKGTYTDKISFSNYVCTEHQFQYMDAGSPLIGYTKKRKPVQLGVLSWIFPHVNGSPQFQQNQNELDKETPYGLFSNLNSEPLHSFIDYHSKMEDARWCKEPANDYLLNIGEVAYDNPYQIPPHSVQNCKCGQRRSPTARIHGGENAKANEFPWLVRLVYSDGSKSSLCGASIINDRMLLTAAHCAAEPPENNAKPPLTRKLKDPTKFTAFANYHTGASKYVILKIDRIIVHPGYLVKPNTPDFTQHENFDVALVVLKDKLDLSDPRFTPICLPTETDIIKIFEGRKATLAGWGLTDRNNPSSTSDITQKITLPLHSDANCKAYGGQTKRMDLFICADFVNISGAAQGDSGGPLMIETLRNEFLQIGVVSHGLYPPNRNMKALKVEAITFYCRVTAFVEWIEFNAGLQEAKWCARKTEPR